MSMPLYLFALLLTILVELAICWLMRKSISRLDAKPIESTSLAINLLTHPTAVIAFAFFSAPFLLVEFAVFIAESVLYRKLAKTTPSWSLFLSGVANATTMTVGILLV